MRRDGLSWWVSEKTFCANEGREVRVFFALERKKWKFSTLTFFFLEKSRKLVVLEREIQ